MASASLRPDKLGPSGTRAVADLPLRSRIFVAGERCNEARKCPCEKAFAGLCCSFGGMKGRAKESAALADRFLT